MNYLTFFSACLICVFLYSCTSPNPPAKSFSEADKEFLGIPQDGKLSAASKRALERGYAQGAEWFCNCKSYDLKGDFAFEEGVTRRDPSAVLSVDGKYYVYYSRTTGITKGFHTGDPANKVFPWDLTEIWYATSEDGWTWKEERLAVGRGPEGAYDDRSVFTPEVMQYEDKF
ncbi:MAG: glycosyl hydrolase, partial [Bacteroidota bacterium]